MRLRGRRKKIDPTKTVFCREGGDMNGKMQPLLLVATLIGALTPKFLCVQNREMHDQMDYFLGGQKSNSYLSSERNPQIVYR